MSSQSTNKVAFLRDRVYVSLEHVTDEMLEAYQTQIEVGVDPYTQEPLYQTLAHYEQFRLSSTEGMIAFNRGDMRKIPIIFKDFQILDQRVQVPMKAPLKIVFPEGKDWREYQPDAIDAMASHEFGLLQSPPRSGKNLMITGTICLQQQKTIVFAHQTDLLLQLHDTFEEFTNLKELQKRTGEKIVGFAETWEDFDRLDVVLCTKQTFDHIDNKRWAAIMQQKFGSVFVDEAHYVGGDVYSRLINRFWSYYRQGVTATVHRKDGLDAIVEGIIGPVIHKIERASVGQVPMEVTIIPTNIKAGGGFAAMLTTLSENEARNNFILGWMRKDVEAGHTIIAVTDRKQHGIELSRALGELGIPSVVFNGNVQDRNLRKNVLDAIRTGKAKVMIGMRGMTTGLDVPRADCFYNLLPSANAVKKGEHAGEGGYEQQCTRVMTPFEGKTKALVRDFVDDFGMAYACLKQREKTYNRLGATIIRERGSDRYKKPVVTTTSQSSTSF